MKIVISVDFRLLFFEPKSFWQIKARGNMTPSSRIERSLELMMLCVSERPDGEIFVPIVLYLERQLAALSDAETEYERIVRLARNRAS
jgi:hypothetical protein